MTFFLYIAAAYFAVAAQALFFSGVKPDFVIVLVCFFALRSSHARGVAYGAFAGMLIDLAGGVLLGPHMISKAFTGFFMRTVREHLFQWNAVIAVLVVAAFSVVDVVFVYACLRTFTGISFLNRPWDLSILQVIYTMAAALCLYLIIRPSFYALEGNT